MNFRYAIIGKWLLGVIYVALWFLLLLALPTWLGLPLLMVFFPYLLWSYWSQEVSAGRSMNLRPLTRWDVPGDPRFLERLEEASRAAGLRRPPIWAVAEDEWMNAWAIGGRRGLVVFTTELLKRLSPEELLAVAGHELQHLAGRDSLPALIGGSWMAILGYTEALFTHLGRQGGGIISALSMITGLLLYLCLLVVGWVAEAFLAKRSRMEEHLADLAGARLTSADTMIQALQRLEERHPSRDGGLSRWSAAWIARRMHASHPPTPERIAYLRRALQGGEGVA
ncbi:MAG: M48 family metallopeptidase [Bacillota bacterium]